jgi:hypothetical protein
VIKWKPYLLGLSVVVVFFVVGFQKIQNLDVWWQVAHGYELLFGSAALKLDFAAPYFSAVTISGEPLASTWFGSIFLSFFDLFAGEFGLSLLRALLILMSLFFVRKLIHRPLNGWSTLLLICFMIGTLSNFVLRTSSFSIVFILLLYVIYQRYCEQPTVRKLLSMAFVFVLWTNVHGSYLYWLIVFPLLLLGEAIDHYRRQSSLSLAQLRYPAVLAVLNVLWCVVHDPRTFVHVQKIPGAILGHFGSGATLFHDATAETAHVILSRDFASSFSVLDRLSNELALVLFILVCLFWLFGTTTRRCTHLALILATGYLGLTYARFVPFLAAVSVMIFADVFRRAEFRMKMADTVPSAVSLLVGPLLIVNLIFGSPITLNASSDEFGVGASTQFQSRVLTVLRQQPETTVFTTLKSGSFFRAKSAYSLFRLESLSVQPKLIYIDGFFAPHYGIFEEYQQITQDGRVDLLTSKYHTQLAYVSLTDQSAQLSFLRSKDWWPIAIDMSAVLYRYQPFQSLEAIPELQVLMTNEEVQSASQLTQTSVYHWFCTQYPKLGLLGRGELSAFEAFVSVYSEFFESAGQKNGGMSAAIPLLFSEMNYKLCFEAENKLEMWQKAQFDFALAMQDPEQMITYGNLLASNRCFSLSSRLYVGLAEVQLQHLDRARELLQEIDAGMLVDESLGKKLVKTHGEFLNRLRQAVE